MTILCDHQIKKLAEEGMISPFVDHQVNKDNSGNKLISYGLSSFGYDARLDSTIKVCRTSARNIIDPKAQENSFSEFDIDSSIIIPPHSFALASTVERFKIPRDVTAICLGKSTYARCGLIVNVTPLESSWEGIVTLELSNTSPFHLKLYINEGICQFLFLKGDSSPDVSYADREGKYMNQTCITLAKV